MSRAQGKPVMESGELRLEMFGELGQYPTYEVLYSHERAWENHIDQGVSWIFDTPSRAWATAVFRACNRLLRATTERVCHLDRDFVEYLGGTLITCSECQYEFGALFEHDPKDDDDPNYCPGCGRRILKEAVKRT